VLAESSAMNQLCSTFLDQRMLPSATPAPKAGTTNGEFVQVVMKNIKISKEKYC